MKNAILSIVLLIGCSLAAQTSKQQHKEEVRHEKIEELTPEQHATLRAKKMALHLDLTQEQQNKVYALELETAKKRAGSKQQREEKQEVSSERIFNRKNEQLDQKIYIREQYQNILTKEQFEKWKKTVVRKKRKGRHNKQKRR